MKPSLALRLLKGSRQRALLLTAQVAISMVVFVVVTSLGRLGDQGLQGAIEADSGKYGSYSVSSTSTLGLSRGEFVDRLQKAAKRAGLRDVRYGVYFLELVSECPPLDGERSRFGVATVWNADGTTLAPQRLAGEPVDLCLGGAKLPDEALYRVPQVGEIRRIWNVDFLLSPDYAQLAFESASDDVAITVVGTAGSVDFPQRFSKVAEAEFANQLGLFTEETQGEPTLLETGVSVNRRDQDLGKVRAAQTTLKTVFGFIGGGVVLLSGLGLLISQLNVLRERRWFFGLARASGAHNRHIASLIVTEMLLVIGLGGLIAVLVILAIRPAIEGFAQQQFGLEIDVYALANFPLLIAAALLVLAISTFWPVKRAIAMDPLDVLEPKEG